jgi:hypothetical protein
MAQRKYKLSKYVYSEGHTSFNGVNRPLPVLDTFLFLFGLNLITEVFIKMYSVTLSLTEFVTMNA